MPAIVRDARRPAHVPEVTAPIRDFRHTPAHPLRSYNLGMSGQKWLNVAAIGTLLVCAIYPLTAMSGEPFTVWPAGVWITAFLAYGVALMAFLGLPVMTPGRFGPHFPVALAGLQSVSGLLMNVISSHHWGGTGIGAAFATGRAIAAAARRALHALAAAGRSQAGHVGSDCPGRPTRLVP
jgi:hypothetical protein